MTEEAKFVPFASFIDTAFWSEINKRKLNEWKLDEGPKSISATVGIGDIVGNDCRMSFGHESFDFSRNLFQTNGVVGDLYVFNSLANFKQKSNEFRTIMKNKVWSYIADGTWMDNPSVLYYFIFAVYADLKKFQYTYWMMNPAIADFFVHLKGLKMSESTKKHKIIETTIEDWVYLIVKDIDCEQSFPLSELRKIDDPKKVEIVIRESSPIKGVPGWPLRNLVTAIAYTKPFWKFVNIRLLDEHECRAIEFSWGEPWSEKEAQTDKLFQAYNITGFEPNAHGKILPRFVDLKNQFDPTRLMEQSVTLNLSLIKWRLVPDMKLERFEALKVLIFGAGTLGCNIARNLLAYNVKLISFIDNSTVSYSNPVRQSLSKFEDARKGKGKAETAATALKEIYPSVDAKAYNLTVPMPGHTIGEHEEEDLRKTVKTLEELVSSHDVIFLALDSREARWLPTVIGAKHSKMVFSVALGFDQFVVIRHGIKPSDEEMETPAADNVIPYSQLGCYFCSDVTAPGNSTTDRTLDQQCTVSRPGLSPIAAGVAIELLASVLQHSIPRQATACIGEQDESSSLFGATPHQIRGYIFRFQQMTPAVRRFEKCVACGAAVSAAYEKDEWEFVKQVLNSPSYLEKVSGLDELHHSVDAVQIDFSDDDASSVMSM